MWHCTTSWSSRPTGLAVAAESNGAASIELKKDNDFGKLSGLFWDRLECCATNLLEGQLLLLQNNLLLLLLVLLLMLLLHELVLNLLLLLLLGHILLHQILHWIN